MPNDLPWREECTIKVFISGALKHQTANLEHACLQLLLGVPLNFAEMKHVDTYTSCY